MCWRKPDASDEEIIKALKIAQAYDFVKDIHTTTEKITKRFDSINQVEMDKLTYEENK